MKSMQRKFGGLMKRSADEADVGAILAEFKSMDDMLDRLIKDLKAYRNAWEDILRVQYDCSEAFATIYNPIRGATKPGDAPPEARHEPTVTPQRYMQKCLGLQKLYSDLKDDLAQEIGMITSKLIAPAEEAKKATKPLHKTLKHRENMKLDYERYLSRAEHARKKETKSAKEEIALQAHEGHLAQARIDYQTADEQIKQTFPPVIEAVMALLPYLLQSQVMLQTTIVGQLYTVLDDYTRKHQLPSPAPGDAEIIEAWEKEFSGFRRELEQGISVIANGKAVHQPMALADKKGGTITGLGIRNRVMHRKPSGQQVGPGAPSSSPRPSDVSSISSGRYGGSAPAYEEEEPAPPKPPRPGAGGNSMPSQPSNWVRGAISETNPGAGSYGMPSPAIPAGSKPRIPSVTSQAPYDQKPTAIPPSWPSNPPPPSYDSAYNSGVGGSSSPPSRYQTPVNDRSPSMLSVHSTNNNGSYFPDASRRPSQSSLASAAAAAAKKKPPPPVPAKRFPSAQQAEYVTAIYDFEGQNEGDLAFNEGDRIKVVKKTDSQDDWWDGELRGRTGAFPANYVQLS
jgi:amphiphysin